MTLPEEYTDIQQRHIFYMETYIKAITYYLPEHILTNEDIAGRFPEYSAEKVNAKVGISKRHIAGENETATDLAEKACLKLFAENPGLRESIDFVLLCTQSPDYFLPSSSTILQHRLGLSTKCGAFDFNLGCSGAIYGLAVAKGLITASIARNVLLITAETYSKYLHPEDKSNISIFGDAATACVISSDKGIAQIGNFVLGSDGTGAENLIVKTGGARHRKATNKECCDDDGHIQRDDYLYMNGSAIFNFTLETVPPMVQQLLTLNNLAEDDIDLYVFHQANKFMLNTLRKCISIPKDKFYVNLSETGNTVSCTIPIALADIWANKNAQKGQVYMLAGFGVGLSWGGTIIRIC